MKTTYQTFFRSIFVAIVLLITCTAQAATVSWTGAGGDNLWHTDANWSSGTVPAPDDDVIVNVPGNPIITMTSLGVSARSVQCSESLRIEDTTLSLTDGASSFTGPLNLSGGWVSVDGAGTRASVSGPLTFAGGVTFYAYNGAELWLTNLTALVLTNGPTFFAQNAAIYLSNLTNVVASEGYTLSVQVHEGGLVDLHRLNNSDGPLWVSSRSAGSVVDLSGLSGALAAPANYSHSFSAENGGSILIPQVTALKRVGVSVTGNGQVSVGAVTNAEESVFYAYDGAKLWLTNLTTLVLTNGSMTLWAQNADAGIYAPNLTNIVSSFSGYSLYVYAYEGGLVDLSGLRKPNSGLQVLSRSAGSSVDLSGLTSALSAPEGFAHSFNADGGSILMPLVTALQRVTVSVTGDGQVGFGAVTNAEQSSFYAYGGGKLWLTNLTMLVLTNGSETFWAQGADTAIDLSNVTNLVSGPGYLLYIYASEGGLVDLHRLRNPSGGLQVLSRSAGSVVDLSGLSGVLAAPEDFSHSFNADGGSIPMPQITALKRVTVSVSGEGQVGFGVLTNAEESSFYAYDGAKLWLTNLTTLVLTDGSITFWAQNAGAGIYAPNLTNIFSSFSGYALYVYAYEGGFVDLHRLRNPDGWLQVLSRSVGSVVDLSGLSGELAAPPGFWYSFNADGGSIPMPQVTALRRVTVSVTGEGEVGFGSLTNAEESSFYAYNGGKLWLTNLATLILTNGHIWLWAQGADTAIYAPNVTNLMASSGYVLHVSAYAGGLVDLHGLRNPSGGLQVYSSSVGSVVDLSGLSGALAAPEGFSHSFSADGGGILMPQVTALIRASVSVTGDGQIGFGILTNAADSSFYTYNGGKLWLTNLTSLTMTNANLYLFAQGAEAVVHLPNLTNIMASSGYSLSVYALEGGMVNLSQLSSFAAGIYVLSRGAGSVVDLSGLSGLAPQVSGSSLHTESEGVILFNETAILIANVALHLESNPDLLAPFMDAGTSLVLYGRAWRAYRIEARDTRVSNASWDLYRRAALTNAFQVVAPRPPLNLEFRVTEIQPEPPELDISVAGPQQAQIILFGVTGQSYRLESKPVLDAAAAWQNGPSVPFTNAFRIFPPASSTDPSRFYRARKL